MRTHIEIPFRGYVLRGMHHSTGGSSQDKPTAVLLHGFTGNRVEAHRLFFQLSAALESVGVDSVRFDFLGCGESDGDYTNVTISSLVDQASAVLHWVRQRLAVRVLYLVGFSLGGLVAAEVAEQEELVRKLVLISPGRARCILKRYESAFADPNQDIVELNGFPISRGYYTNLPLHVDKPARFLDSQEILVIHGSNDTVTPIEYGKEYLTVQGGRRRFVEIPGADHTYTPLACQERLRAEVIQFLAN